MVLGDAAAVAGSYHTDAEINQVRKSGVAVTKGKLVFFDETDDNWKISPAAAGTTGPFGVAVNKDALAADPKMDVAVSGHVIVTADGAIQPGNYVIASAATAGEVIEYARTGGGAPTALQAADEFRRVVGRYIGKAAGNERDGATITAAADGDKIWIKLGLVGGGV